MARAPSNLTGTDLAEYRDAIAGGYTAARVILPCGSAYYLSDASAGGRCYAMGFAGRAARSTFHFAFRDADEREAFISRWVEKQAAGQAQRQERAAARKSETHAFSVGDILVSSWGYEQTNVDFYEVVKVVSAKTVELRPIESTCTPDAGVGAMTGKAVPQPGAYAGESFRKRASGDRVSLCSYRSATRWGGQPMAWTSYA